MLNFPLGYGVCIQSRGSDSDFIRFSSQGRVVKLLDLLRLNEVSKRGKFTKQRSS
jgi:hypothetical protein